MGRGKDQTRNNAPGEGGGSRTKCMRAVEEPREC